MLDRHSRAVQLPRKPSIAVGREEDDVGRASRLEFAREIRDNTLGTARSVGFDQVREAETRGVECGRHFRIGELVDWWITGELTPALMPHVSSSGPRDRQSGGPCLEGGHRDSRRNIEPAKAARISERAVESRIQRQPRVISGETNS